MDSCSKIKLIFGRVEICNKEEKMEKLKNFLLKIISIISLLIILCTPIAKADSLDPYSYKPSTGGINQDIVVTYASKISNFLYVISVIVAIISFMVLGIQYITGGISGKVDYKKNLIPMVIGIGIIAFLATIIRIIIGLANGL